MTLLRALTLLSGIAFLLYGIICVSSRSMVGDFHRFGMDNLRVFTGCLEILAGIGLFVGLWWLPAQVLSAGGLALLMLVAFCIRVRLRDSLAAALPSLLLLFLNVFIVIKALQPRR